MDEEIHFGEVEEASPRQALRPDQNKHFAVCAYESPAERDLPIFVDLDVLADMEEHALSDTSVELGGVLLGGVHEDENGSPFVVITDSLRAQHYESTKGSFKFTHDTWSAITREREEFPDELQMVGWYHTHPDWGVFLSSMDMFICDNFFNKRLDVAFVIDPCRGDRGMFQWTGDARQRVRRTGGFFVTASRFRAAELEQYVAELSGTMPATTSPRGTTGAYPAPVVHLHQPPPPPRPPWLEAGVLGMLALQFCLVALIAWKMIEPAGAPDAEQDKVVEALEKLQDTLAARAASDNAAQRVRAQSEVLDAVVGELRSTEPGFVERLQERYDQTNRLAGDVAARDSQIRELSTTLEQSRQRLKSTESLAKSEQDRLRLEVATLTTRLEQLTEDHKTQTKKLAALEGNKKSDDGDLLSDDAGRSVWWYVLGGAVIAAIVVPGVWWLGKKYGGEAKQDEEAARDDNGQSPDRI